MFVWPCITKKKAQLLGSGALLPHLVRQAMSVSAELTLYSSGEKVLMSCKNRPFEMQYETSSLLLPYSEVSKLYRKGGSIGGQSQDSHRNVKTLIKILSSGGNSTLFSPCCLFFPTTYWYIPFLLKYKVSPALRCDLSPPLPSSHTDPDSVIFCSIHYCQIRCTLQTCALLFVLGLVTLLFLQVCHSW